MGNIRKSESQGDSSPDLGPTLLADQGVKAGAVTSARLQFRLQFRLSKTFIFNLFKTVNKMSEITFNTCIGRYGIQYIETTCSRGTNCRRRSRTKSGRLRNPAAAFPRMKSDLTIGTHSGAGGFPEET